MPVVHPEGDPSGVSVVVASGGLLTKGGVTPVIAIVHRPKYDDWSLPKGKLESGESAEQAALREVGEETGCRARLGRFAGMLQYPLKNGLKLVLFWHMEVEAEDTGQLGDDVDRVLWLSPREAAGKLSHEGEVALVRREFAGWRPALVRGWERIRHLAGKPWGRSLPYLRLESAIVAFRAQLEWRRHQSAAVSKSRTPGAHPPIWFLICSQLLTEAEVALHTRERDKAWACFEAAQRMEVFAYNHHESCARALTLRAEARDKIAGWRKHAIEQILPDTLLTNDSPPSDTSTTAATSNHPIPQTGPASSPVPTPALARLQVALAHGLQVRDEHFQNNYFKLALVNRQIRLLIYCLLLVLLFVLNMAHHGSLPSMLEPPQYGFELYLAVVLFGAMGGVLSVLLTLGNAPSDSRIPEAINTNRGYTLRPLLGAAAALVTLLFLASGILNLGVMTNARALTIAFVAGFSERFLLSAVNALPTQKTADKSP